MAKRFVFTVWGSLGDLHPYLAIGRGLRGRGHGCVIATNNFHRERVEEAGLEFAPMGPHIDADPALMKKSTHLRRGPRFLLRDLVIPYAPQAFRESLPAIAKADLVVTHPLGYGAHLAVAHAGTPWVSTALAPAGFFSACEPSVRMQSPWLSKLEIAGPWLDRTLLKIVRRVTGEWLGPITKLRADLGLLAGANPILEGQFSPAKTLALFSPLLGKPQPDWPPNTTITGFPFYNEPAAMDAELRNFLTDGEPPVVFTLGSSASMAPRRFFEESLKAVKQLRRRAALIVGSYAPNLYSQDLPAGVAAFPYAPYGELFPRAAVIVHQGGVGTLAQAMRSGHPMLVVPFSFDQPDNAARVKKLGVARSISIAEFSARTALKELEPLLHEEKYAIRAAEVAVQVCTEDGVGRACDELVQAASSQ